MPNDVADWDSRVKANLVGGLSGAVQGDVSAQTLNPDTVTETMGGTAGFGGWNNIALASFKAAAASVIAKVGALGTLAVGTSTSVSPTFGQSPTAGNLLVAWVTAGSADPTTNAAGWVKAVTNNFNGQFSAIWYKPNAAGADAAPVFTVGAGSNLMSAQLGEFSGAATASPLDQTGTGGGTSNPITVAAGGADVAFGDLVLTASRWIETQPGTAIFTDTINNGGVVVQAGSAQVGDVASRACNFTYTIIPGAATAAPLGVSLWPTKQPLWLYPNKPPVIISGNIGAASSKAIVAGVAGQQIYIFNFDAYIVDTTALGADPELGLLDDTAGTILWIASFTGRGRVGGFDMRGAAGPALGNGLTVHNYDPVIHNVDFTLAYSQGVPGQQ